MKKKNTFGYIVTFLTLGSISLPAFAQDGAAGLPGYGYNPFTVPRTTVLDSWMQPTVLRTRQIIGPNGEKKDIAEPLVMERHERVIVPYDKITTTTTATSASRYREERNFQHSKVIMASAHKHYPHQLRHHASSTMHPRQKQYIASRRTVIESRPQQVEVNQRVVERSVIIERPDPSLNIY